jgi:hypothetical protein
VDATCHPRSPAITRSKCLSVPTPKGLKNGWGDLASVLHVGTSPYRIKENPKGIIIEDGLGTEVGEATKDSYCTGPLI